MWSPSRRQLLAVGDDGARSTEGDVDLLLAELLGALGEHLAADPVWGVVVLRVGRRPRSISEIGEDPERAHPQVPSDAAQADPLEDPADRVELVDPLVGDVGHGPSYPLLAPRGRRAYG